MKGDRKRKRCGFQKGHTHAKGREMGVEPALQAEYPRPSQEEAALLDVDPVMHEAMASTSTSDEERPSVMILRPQLKKPDYKPQLGNNGSKLR